MTPTRYRLIFLGLGLALVLVVLFAVVFTPGGGEFRLPDPVESISPANDETVQRQIDLNIDMAVGYRIELFVDGFRIPDDEIIFSEATGRHTWRPAASETFPEWSTGLHTVLIEYEAVGSRPDLGSLRWVFRVL